MKYIATLIPVLSLLVSSLWADRPVAPFAYVTAGFGGTVYYKMMPDPSGNWNEGHGVAYRVRADGSDEELWRTAGWYSFEVFISSDGNYLVAMGPWNTGSEPSTKDLAIAFYRKGKLLREYSTAELVKDKGRVKATVNHYMWLARDVRKTDPNIAEPESDLRLFWDNTFRLTTCEGIVYYFDATTGDIKNTES